MSMEQCWYDTDTENLSTCRKACPSATLYTTNLMQTDWRSSPGLYSERMVTDCLSEPQHNLQTTVSWVATGSSDELFEYCTEYFSSKVMGSSRVAEPRSASHRLCFVKFAGLLTFAAFDKQLRTKKEPYCNRLFASSTETWSVTKTKTAKKIYSNICIEQFSVSNSCLKCHKLQKYPVRKVKLSLCTIWRHTEQWRWSSTHS